MCGIIGYSGHRPAIPVVLEGLHRMEYRGYDSSGISFVQNNELVIVRAPGKLKKLEDELAKVNHSLATTAIGHTRWATHGAPTRENAHPHISYTGDICLAHNGIIENYQELKKELLGKGIEFKSETDTEVLVNTVQEELNKEKNTLKAFANALKKASGTYAVAMCLKNEPNVIYAARNAAPLILGIGSGENFISSDIPAFLPYTREAVFLEDRELVRITPKSWEVFSLDDLSPKTKEIHKIEWDVQSAQKGGYKHFMLKEIFEQPKVIKDCVAGRISPDKKSIKVPELEKVKVPKRLRIVACGTSYHAGLWAMPLFERWSGMPCSVEIASEFRYRSPKLDKEEVLLVISQSGETADTIAGLRTAKEENIPVIGLCNVVGSTIARESDAVIYTQAGPEISVASTKALSSQMVVLMLIAAAWGSANGNMPKAELEELIRGLGSLPAQIESILPSLQNTARELAIKYSSIKGIFFMGRGLSYPMALEGALKLKELSYIHAEGYPAGEIKHGPIALIEPDFLSFFLAPHDKLFLKTKSNIEEVQSRKGPVIALTHPQKDELEIEADHIWIIPEAWGPLASLLMLPALQLFSYEMAYYLGKDVDQPRNLAKSVTVE